MRQQVQSKLTRLQNSFSSVFCSPPHIVHSEMITKFR